MNSLKTFLVFCSLLSQVVFATDSLEHRVTNALVDKAAMSHVMTAFGESHPMRKKLIKSLLADCKLTAEELQKIKDVVLELREILPIVAMQHKEFVHDYNALVEAGLKKELASEENPNDAIYRVTAEAETQCSQNPKYARYIKARDRLEELQGQAIELFKSLVEPAQGTATRKMQSLMTAGTLYAGLMFNQLTDEVIEAASELQK